MLPYIKPGNNDSGVTLHAFNPALTAKSRWVGLKILIVGGWGYLLHCRWGDQWCGVLAYIYSCSSLWTCFWVLYVSSFGGGGAESTPIYAWLQSWIGQTDVNSPRKTHALIQPSSNSWESLRDLCITYTVTLIIGVFTIILYIRHITSKF